MRAFGVAAAAATVFCTSSPLSGSMLRLRLFMSAMKSGSSTVAMKALRSASLRSGGIAGSATSERPISGPAAEESENIARALVGREIEQRRIVRQIFDAAGALRIEDSDQVLVEPFAAILLDRLPAHAADRLRLAAHHGERLVGRAAESENYLDLGPDQVVERGRDEA